MAHWLNIGGLLIKLVLNEFNQDVPVEKLKLDKFNIDGMAWLH